MDIPRKIALNALYKIDNSNAYSNIVLDEILNGNRSKLNEKDVNFISELVYGVTTWRLTLDCIIQKYSKIKLKKISLWVLNILRLGVYQIVFLDRVPKSAAVNECVNLCKKYGNKSIGFVNAILRKVTKQDYEDLKKIENDIERISKLTSMPVWIVEELEKEFELEKVKTICENSNIKPKLTIRTNTLKITKQELKNRLKENKIDVEEANLDDFLYLKNTKNITGLEEYKNGLFTIQDEAAGLTALVLEPKSGEKILDCCSAPGGKTTYIAEKMKNNGEIIAWDLHENRIENVKENAKRLGISIIKGTQQDASILKEEYIEKFDKILLDVPCLGLGVIKRKPDIKWQRNKKDIEEITNIQKQILNICSKYLKKNGILIYSTCSIIKEENSKIIQEFIKNNEFELVNINVDEVKKIKDIELTQGEIKLYPNNENDGFFIAKMKKK